jgi:hypothetical protein
VLTSNWEPDFAAIARFCNEKGAFDLALAAADAGLRRSPRNALLQLRRVESLDGLGDFEGALAAANAALAATPSDDVRALLHSACALAAESLGRLDEAARAACRAIELSPNLVEPHCTYGGILGRSGAFERAWPELEFFWLGERAWFRRRFGRAEWNGEPLGARRLLVVHGQGAGDLIQMARYLPRLRELAGDVVVEATPALIELVAGIPGLTVAPRDTVVWTAPDAFARAMALPRLLGATADGGGAYLHVPSARRERWAARLGPPDGRRRVGLVWAGNPFNTGDRLRSIKLAAFAPLAGVAGVRWISLQVGARAGDPAPPGLALERFHGEIADFSDTAALAAACDLVIAVDTAVAHLAGALGVPVWLLLAARPEWRWPRSGERSPWYAGTRLVHAARTGWEPAIARVAAELAAGA